MGWNLGIHKRTGKVEYGDMNDIKLERWQVWDIPLYEFALNNLTFNLRNVVQITIRFGDAPQGNNGIVYFDDIRLYEDMFPSHKKTATVEYGGDVNDVKEEFWHRWIIPLEEFTDINLANIERITIGFADSEPSGSIEWNPVYFDSIRLCKRSPEDPNVPAGDIYPQVLSEDPFEFTYYCYPYSLKQDCNLIDAGYNYIDESTLIGRTTHAELVEPNVLVTTPDSNMTDIGFHYIAWGYVNAGDGNGPAADLNGDWMVNFGDFAVLADGWLTDYAISDLDVMADEWLEAVDPHPPIAVTVSGDPNNLTGDIAVGISGYGSTTARAFVLMDGEYIGEIPDFEDEGCVGLDSRIYDNGQHTIKVVAADANSIITVSENATIDFNNELYYINGGDNFKEGHNYYIYAMNSSGNNLRVKVADWNDTVIWISPTLSGNISLAIPESVFSGPIYDVIIEEESTLEMFGGGFDGQLNLAVEGDSESWKSIWARAISKPYVPGNQYKFAIFLPSIQRYVPPYNSADCRKQTVAEIVRICESRSMPYVVLYKGECTWENFESVLSKPSVSYAYMVTHGGVNVGTVPEPFTRTFFFLTDSTVLSYYSEDLPKKIKDNKNIHYMRSLGLGLTNRMRIVHIDSCSQGSYDDMADEWIDSVLIEEPSLDQLFTSWGPGMVLYDDDWDKWSRDLWYKFGEEKNYQQAVDYALSQQEGQTFNLIRINRKHYGFYQITFTGQGN
jgi:hypothetical protein